MNRTETNYRHQNNRCTNCGHKANMHDPNCLVIMDKDDNKCFCIGMQTVDVVIKQKMIRAHQD